MPAGPTPFEVHETPSTVLTITGSDGQRYEVKVAMVVLGVMDTGLINPLDQMPIFNVSMQPVTQVKRKADG